MTAKIFTMPSRKSAPAIFGSFTEIFAFDPPEPAWVSEDMAHSDFRTDDAVRLRAWFEWFGASVDTTGPATSLVEGWAYLRSEIATAGLYRMNHPKTFRDLYNAWSGSQVAYLDAVLQGDQTSAAALLPRTPFANELDEKMRTQEGCALNTSGSSFGRN
jgi:hypothetical protein